MWVGTVGHCMGLISSLHIPDSLIRSESHTYRGHLTPELAKILY